ncbi:MAG: hypothetical protein LRY54_00755 [Alphaproteobacteria bacterium]|nr:hypothetical protein [Alphaproteobacteria bacterium]
MPEIKQQDIVIPLVELDTSVPEPGRENIQDVPKFLYSSPSFRVLLYSTTLSMSAVFATAAAFVYLNTATPAASADVQQPLPEKGQALTYEQR